MSEQQYYEFRSLDRPLTARQRSELRAISTRAEITSTSFTNVYTFGDFKGDPVAMVEQFLRLNGDLIAAPAQKLARRKNGPGRTAGELRGRAQTGTLRPSGGRPRRR